MSTISAKRFVNVTPSVESAGGNALDVIGLFLTKNTRVPIGTVRAFDSVTGPAFFGAASPEAAKMAVYFKGFDNSNVKPGSILFAQYPTAPVSAYLQGASVAALTLTQLQAINATLSVTIDGVVKTATVNLSAATSFSNAAEIIAQDLAIEGVQAAAFTGAIAGLTLTVSAVSSGALGVGDVLVGAGVTANTYISALGTGVGGVGTYTVSTSQTVSSESMTAFTPAVQFDSVSGAFIILSGTTGVTSTITFASGAAATTLGLTLANGAFLSQGAIAAVPSSFMANVLQQTTDWATFVLMFDPDNGSGNTQKMLFATWTDQQLDRYAFICHDSDPAPAANPVVPASMGALLKAQNLSGTCIIWEPSDQSVAAFVSGAAASIDFSETNGRTDFDFLSQTGLVAGVTDDITAANLASNGYNFYGAVGTANQNFTFFTPGSVSGPFDWLDSYINQIQLNNAFQLALLSFMTKVRSIPYTDIGITQIEAAMADSIAAGLNFGTYRAGVTLSSQQASDVNTEAGLKISDTLSTQGWYLQILQASPTVRQQRGSPPMKFWYTDGESVQTLNLASINVQ